jgi:putative nucleotidyltransferase with HDIG domain
MSPTRDTLVAALNRVQDLPTLPSVVTQMEEILRRERTTADDLARIISADPTLTTNVLRVVNSAYYAARSGRITSVHHAVARLGFREVGRICTVLTVIETFRGFGPHLDHKVFWKHSLMTGISTRVIYRHSRRTYSFEEDEAYVAGLLHDVGVLILDQYFPALYQRTRKQAAEKSVPYAEEERQFLGMDHGELGATVLNRWNISPAVVQAVAWHHQPSRCDPQSRDLASTVHLADSICLKLEIGDFADGGLYSVYEGVRLDLGLAPGDLPAIIADVRKDRTQCESLLHL